MQNLNQKQNRTAINNYEYVCQTIVATTNIMEYNFTGKCAQGKKLKTSASNAVQPNTTVTPDLAIEISIEKEDYRAVNEIKAGLPEDKNHWISTAKQLKKYDDDLDGWNHTNSKKHDILITTNELRVFELKKYLDELASAGTIKFDRNLAILHSTRSEQLGSFINIRKDYGTISSKKLDDMLSSGVGIPEHNIVKEISQMKFYDSNPPIIYMMMIIWDHVLKTFLGLKQLRELKGNQTIPVVVTVKDVYDKLLRFTPASNPKCIEHTAVKTALLGFVEMGMAILVNSQEEKFEIRFRKHKGKLLDWLFEKIEKPEKMNPTTTLDQFVEKEQQKGKKPTTDQNKK
jgi:hypothetical protein